MMKHTKILILFLLCALNIRAGYWEGTIGNHKVYLELKCQEKSCYARYFYESSLQDIVSREANKIDDHYRLQIFDGEELAETFLLTQKSDNLLVGSWKSKDKTLNVKLNRLNLKNEEVFDDYRTKFLKYKRHNIEKLVKHKKELVWIEEQHSKTLFFRLGNGFSNTSRAHLNPVLDKLQNKYSVVTLICSSPWLYGSGMEPIKAQYTYLSENLIGVEFSLNYFCGAYPDFYTMRQLYDLHTGYKYKLTDIITIGQDAAKLRELAFKAKGVPLKPQEKPEEDSYDPYDIERWESAGWSYTKKGIRIYLNFSSYERCFRGDNYLIPFELLKPYKNHLFKYKFGT